MDLIPPELFTTNFLLGLPDPEPAAGSWWAWAEPFLLTLLGGMLGGALPAVVAWRAQREIADSQAIHSREIETLRQEHATALATLRQEHDTALATFQAGQATRLEQVKGQVRQEAEIQVARATNLDEHQRERAARVFDSALRCARLMQGTEPGDLALVDPNQVDMSEEDAWFRVNETLHHFGQVHKKLGQAIQMAEDEEGGLLFLGDDATDSFHQVLVAARAMYEELGSMLDAAAYAGILHDEVAGPAALRDNAKSWKKIEEYIRMGREGREALRTDLLSYLGIEDPLAGLLGRR